MNIINIMTGEKSRGLSWWSKKNKIPADLARDISRCVQSPEETPFIIHSLISDFRKLKSGARREVRNGLIRVQIAASVTNPQDPVMMEKQLYVVQAIEKLLFGDNMLLRDEMIELDSLKEEKKRARRR